MKIIEYNQLPEKSTFLKDSKEIFQTLTESKFLNPKLPYPDELITENGTEELELSKVKSRFIG